MNKYNEIRLKIMLIAKENTQYIKDVIKNNFYNKTEKIVKIVKLFDNKLVNTHNLLSIEVDNNDLNINILDNNKKIFICQFKL